MIKLRITLESKQDVIREIVIDSELNLEQLHTEIIKHFKLDAFEMASFYIADVNLDLGQEIPLFDNSAVTEGTVETTIVSVLKLSRKSISSIRSINTRLHDMILVS